MNRQLTEEDMTVAEYYQQIKRIINDGYLSDEDYLEKGKGRIPKIREILDELEAYYKRLEKENLV